MKAGGGCCAVAKEGQLVDYKDRFLYLFGTVL